MRDLERDEGPDRRDVLELITQKKHAGKFPIPRSSFDVDAESGAVREIARKVP